MRDEGPKCISLRWVFKEKPVAGNKMIKRRLRDSEIEETQDFRTDSLIYLQEGLRIAIYMVLFNKGNQN